MTQLICFSFLEMKEEKITSSIGLAITLYSETETVDGGQSNPKFQTIHYHCANLLLLLEQAFFTYLTYTDLEYVRANIFVKILFI